jgi:hypothetical protein
MTLSEYAVKLVKYELSTEYTIMRDKRSAKAVTAFDEETDIRIAISMLRVLSYEWIQQDRKRKTAKSKKYIPICSEKRIIMDK